MCVGALATAFAAELAVRAIAPALPPRNGGLTRELEANVQRLTTRTEPIDTIIVGASQAGTDIDPEALDRQSTSVDGAHTIWMPGASVGTIAALAEDLALPHGTPERLVIGLTSRELNRSDTARQEADQSVLNSVEYRRATDRDTIYDRLDSIGGTASALIRERDRLRSPYRIAKKLLGKDSSLTDLLQTNRFGMHTDRLLIDAYAETDAHLAQERQAMASFALDDDGLAQLESVVGKARASGVEVIIVQLPVYERHYLALQPGLAADDAGAVAAIAALAERSNATYLDARKALDWDDPQWWATPANLRRSW